MAMENGLVAGGVVEGVELDAARCFADGLLATFGPERLSDDTLHTSPEFERSRVALAQRCGI